MIMWFWLIEQNAVNVFVTDLGHTKKIRIFNSNQEYNNFCDSHRLLCIGWLKMQFKKSNVYLDSYRPPSPKDTEDKKKRIFFSGDLR